MKINTSIDFVYDVRLLERHIASGRITRKDVDAYLRSLPDVTEKMEIVPLQAIFDLPKDNDREDDN